MDKDNMLEDDNGSNFPLSLSIEKQVLGILLKHPEAYLKCSHIELDYFYLPDHRNVFSGFVKSMDETRTADIVMLSHTLGKTIKTPLTEYLENVSDVKMLDKYIAELATLDAKRKLLALSQKITVDMETCVDIDSLISQNIDILKGMLNKKKASDISTFGETWQATVESIDAAVQGKGAFLMTKWEQFNNIASIPRKNNILVAAADKESGKTNWVIALEKQILDLNENVMLLHVTMEEPKEKVIRRFMSEETGLSERQLLNVNYQQTHEDHDKMSAALLKFKEKNYDLYFIEKKLDIKRLKMFVRKFNEKAKEEGKDLLVVIDNLGLIDDEGFKEDVARENHIAGEFVGLRDETKASFIIIHHLTKGQINKYQIAEGYRPREEYIRGSSRIVDYANQVMLINLPKRYPDLMDIYKRRDYKIPENIESLYLEDVVDLLWEINSNSDWDTKNIADLKAATINEMRTQVINRTKPDGTKMTPGYIYMQYIKYANAFDAKEELKKEEYRKDKPAILTFLQKNGIAKKYGVTKSPRDMYLFGDKFGTPSENLAMLEHLFIIEFTKNRNSDSSNNIVRFNAELNSNKFLEI